MPDPANVPDLPPLREVIAAFGIGARKSLGQHFLLDINLTRRIARAAGDLTRGTVIEVGPGPGGLTRGLLLEGAREIVAIERDERCLGALEALAEAFPGRLRFVLDDALEADLCGLARSLPGPVKLVANLPYNVATALLIRWFGDIGAFASLTVMVQKEVAARLSARPRTKAYGRLSVLCQWLCTVQILFDVPARAFTPPPKVTSTVIELVPRAAPLAPAPKPALEAVTAAAFGQRRKMLRTSLKTLGVDAAALIAEAGVNPTARAEELSVEEFCGLARAFAAQAKKAAPNPAPATD